MEMSPSSAWLSELEMEDEGFMNEFDQMSKLYDPIDNISVDSFSSENITFIEQSFEIPASFEQQADTKLTKANSISKITPTPKPHSTALSSNTFTISFGDIKPKDEILQFSNSYGYTTASTNNKITSSTSRNPIQAQDHVLAERKRRVKLNERFISLSSLLPNLKKMDKASVLEDAANHIRELQSRVKELGRLSGVKRKDTGDSVISSKRSRLSGSDDESSSDDKPNSCKISPEIEARLSRSTVVVTIQCQKNSSLLIKALVAMQKLGLSVVNSSAMPFADTTLLITIVAQIEDEFLMTATYLVKNLQSAI